MREENNLQRIICSLYRRGAFRRIFYSRGVCKDTINMFLHDKNLFIHMPDEWKSGLGVIFIPWRHMGNGVHRVHGMILKMDVDGENGKNHSSMKLLRRGIRLGISYIHDTETQHTK
jgi:hypothetical protein